MYIGCWERIVVNVFLPVSYVAQVCPSKIEVFSTAMMSRIIWSKLFPNWLQSIFILLFLTWCQWLLQERPFHNQLERCTNSVTVVNHQELVQYCDHLAEKQQQCSSRNIDLYNRGYLPLIMASGMVSLVGGILHQIRSLLFAIIIGKM